MHTKWEPLHHSSWPTCPSSIPGQQLPGLVLLLCPPDTSYTSAVVVGSGSGV